MFTSTWFFSEPLQQVVTPSDATRKTPKQGIKHVKKTIRPKTDRNKPFRCLFVNYEYI